LTRYTEKLATTATCDKDCKATLLCDLKSGRSYDRDHLCQDIYMKIANNA